MSISLFANEKEHLEDIEELIAFVEEMRFDRLGVFTYSHEEGTSGYLLEDTLSAEEKAQRASRVMEVQQQISFEKNQEKIGKIFKVLIDAKEGGNFIGRTEFDSPEVDNEVLIDASKHYLRIGDFAMVKITRAEEFDLFGEPVQ